jgi:hypothetical protein
MPALAGECVSAKARSGYATAVILVPTVETTWLIHRSMKSRLCRSDGAGAGTDTDQSPVKGRRG